MTRDLVAILPDPPAAALPPSATAVSRSGLCAVLAPAAPRLGRASTRRAVARQALARQRVLEALMPCGPVLPAAPGTRLSAHAAGALLAGHASGLSARLRALDGVWQYQTVLGWDEPQVLRRFADAPELAPVLAGGRVSGPALARAVGRLSERLAGEAAGALSACARDVVALPRDGGTLLNVALLLETGRESALDAVLGRIDRIWTEGFRIRLIGPGPAVSFAMLSVREVTSAEAVAAAGRLGLPGLEPRMPLPELRRAALRSGTAPPAEIEAACATLAALDAAPPGEPAFVVDVRRDGGAAVSHLARVA